MYGTLAGNIIGTAYYLSFQAAGFLMVSLFFRRESLGHRLLIGSVAGSVMLIWLPLLFSFFFDFTLLSHVLALFVTLPVSIVALKKLFSRHSISCRLFPRGTKNCTYLLDKQEGRCYKETVYQHLPFGILCLLFMIFWSYLLHTHTLLSDTDGGFYTGQCTYGDMNMHLGFLTSLTKQGTFPPDYSIMPGVKLSYPFASDSISASIYLMGASLRYAYMLPMFFAMAQIFVTVYLFARTLFPSQCKKSSGKLSSGTALLVLLLFFCNGGLGFAYFLDWPQEGGLRFSDIFTGFYTTPTNLVGKNIRWVNIIADMLLPQRATLFGYAVLFPMLWLLYQAVFQERREYFPLAGLFAAALPMIHTHSFLSAGVVSAVWMLLWLYRKVCRSAHKESSYEKSQHKEPSHGKIFHGKSPHEKPSHKVPMHEKSFSGNSFNKHIPNGKIFLHESAFLYLGGISVALFAIIMCLLQFLNTKNMLSPSALVALALLPFLAATLIGFLLLFRFLRQNGWRELCKGWGIFLLCVLTLALPQLLYWTFGQVATGGFVRGYFNWGNQGDFYLWFYLKNMGLPLFLIIGAACSCTRRTLPLLLPALFLWWLGELMVFTPNTYDNNKLLYVAYLLLCFAAADYGVKLFHRLKKLGGAGFLVVVFLFFSALSGILTLGREAVSRYQLYNAAQVSLAEYVEENTAPDSVFLTGTRHNNEIAALTGRNIVCGADTFLYFHGLDTTERKSDLQLMYEAPAEHMDLFEKYNVSYVVVSSYERHSYDVDEATLRDCFSEIFSYGDTALYATSVNSSTANNGAVGSNTDYFPEIHKYSPIHCIISFSKGNISPSGAGNSP